MSKSVPVAELRVLLDELEQAHERAREVGNDWGDGARDAFDRAAELLRARIEAAERGEYDGAPAE